MERLSFSFNPANTNVTAAELEAYIANTAENVVRTHLQKQGLSASRVIATVHTDLQTGEAQVKLTVFVDDESTANALSAYASPPSTVDASSTSSLGGDLAGAFQEQKQGAPISEVNNVSVDKVSVTAPIVVSSGTASSASSPTESQSTSIARPLTDQTPRNGNDGSLLNMKLDLDINIGYLQPCTVIVTIAAMFASVFLLLRCSRSD